MLKKLLKYDLKSIIPFLCIFYILAIGFAGLSRLFLHFGDRLIWNIIGQIFSGAAISMMFSIFINTAMRAWVLFRQNLYGDPSYLTHTLPVRKQDIYLSKALTGIIALLISFVVIGLSFFIQYYDTAVWTLLHGALQLFRPENLGVVAGLLLLIVFLQIANVLQCGFAGLILGHKKNKNKLVWSVLAGLGVYAVGQILLLAVVGILALFDQGFMNLFTAGQLAYVDGILALITVCGILDAALLAGIYFLNVRLLNQGVNVD